MYRMLYFHAVVHTLVTYIRNDNFAIFHSTKLVFDFVQTAAKGILPVQMCYQTNQLVLTHHIGIVTIIVTMNVVRRTKGTRQIVIVTVRVQRTRLVHVILLLHSYIDMINVVGRSWTKGTWDVVTVLVRVQVAWFFQLLPQRVIANSIVINAIVWATLWPTSYIVKYI